MDIEYRCSICGAKLSLIQKTAGWRHCEVVLVRPCEPCVNTTGAEFGRRDGYDNGFVDGTKGFEHKYDPEWGALWERD